MASMYSKQISHTICPYVPPFPVKFPFLALCPLFLHRAVRFGFLGVWRRAGARSQPCGRCAGRPAETVLFSGAIYTVDPERSWAQALAIRAGEIVFVGDDAGAQAYVSPGTKTVDLEGRMVLPGFHDSHMHAESASVFVNKCNLYGLADKQAVIDKLTQCAASNPDSAWVLGEGWLRACRPSARKSSIKSSRTAPCYLAAMDGHHALVNSQGLEAVGITAETPDPVAGIIHRNAAGEPSGLLIESAMWLPKPHLPETSESDQVRILQAACRRRIDSASPASSRPGRRQNWIRSGESSESETS